MSGEAFVRTLAAGGESSDPLTLSAEQAEHIEKQVLALDRCRAASLVTAARYVVAAARPADPDRDGEA